MNHIEVEQLSIRFGISREQYPEWVSILFENTTRARLERMIAFLVANNYDVSKLRQGELGQLIGRSREKVSKAFSEMRREGVEAVKLFRHGGVRNQGRSVQCGRCGMRGHNATSCRGGA